MKAPVARALAFPAISTVLVLAVVVVTSGWGLLPKVLTLVVLEVLLSFDNAFVNATLLRRLSPFWQWLFLGVGIIIAVFFVRFALPILIVAVTAQLGVGEVVRLAANDTDAYAAHIADAIPAIGAFGATYLLLLVFDFFLSAGKDVHWIAPIEKRLAAAGKWDNVGIALTVAGILAMGLTVAPESRFQVLIGATFALLLHLLLRLIPDPHGTLQNGPPLIGGAAFLVFLQLEAVDASFSLDGVVAAFAITDNILVFVAGLGIGALWVRSFTIILVRVRMLDRVRYLAHGAFYAIGVLVIVMVLKVYHIELPEILVGLASILPVAASIWFSVRHRKQVGGL